MATVDLVEISMQVAGVVIRDYDPVTYLTEGCPTPGHLDLSVTYGGQTIFFATAMNRDAFEANPRKYMPRFGRLPR